MEAQMHPLEVKYADPVAYASDYMLCVVVELLLEKQKCFQANAKEVAVDWSSPSSFSFDFVSDDFKTTFQGTRVTVHDGATQISHGCVTSVCPLSKVSVSLAEGCPLFGHPEIKVFVHGYEVLYLRQFDAIKKWLKGSNELYQQMFIGNLSRIHEQSRWAVDVAHENVNEFQRKAIEHALSRRFSAIHGPPGTGKSTCIAAQAIALVGAGKKATIVAQTNQACNHIIRILRDRGDGRIQMLRVVGQRFKDTMLDDILPFCAHIMSGDDHRIEKMLIDMAPIVVVTACAIGGMRFRPRPRCALIVDEANELTDPELLVPFQWDPETVTLYGDSKQIGPFCHSDLARVCGYSVSLMERICELCERDSTLNYKPLLLQIQY
jgi:hypothetical protein